MTPPARPIDKVLIYATLRERLLVFAEPDSPQMPLQVPGGTVDPGEDVHLAAYREFEEETGIKVRDGMAHLETVDYAFPDEQGTELHRRHCFHLRLRDEQPETWDHYEMSPCDGGAPILFRLFWLDRQAAQARQGFEMAKSLDKISF